MKVLIVDDEALVRKALKRALELHKHEVYEATDGAEGLTLWRALQPQVVFLDIVMPGLTGPQVLKEIGKRGSTKVVLMSAFAGPLGAELAPESYDAFIAKPFEDIFDIIKRFCG